VREIFLQGQLSGGGARFMKFDWLEKATRSSASKRVKAALMMDRGNPGFNSRVGGRAVDPWVPANRDLTSLFERLYPPKSEGRFFPRLSQGSGEERLEFVTWLRTQLSKYAGHQVVIFDPYFEDAGLGLLLLCALQGADCLVFRSLPRPIDPTRPDTDKPSSRGFDNLLANCVQNQDRLKQLKLRIFGLKHGRLHDRYLLIIAPDGLPAAGFILSNSDTRRCPP
jgi:hypothetical protein